MMNYPSWLRRYEKMMKELNSTDIFFNGHRFCYLLMQDASYHQILSPFISREDMTEQIRIMAKQANLRIDASIPFAGARVASLNLRWHALISPASPQPQLTFRRMKFNNLDCNKFEGEERLYEVLNQTADKNPNIIICGPTGSGKTTLLTSLMQKYYSQERVVILEDIEEVPLLSKNWIKLRTTQSSIHNQKKISFKLLLEQTLRLRPDKIVCSEVREEESYAFFETFSYSHSGSFTTFHANDLRALKDRLKHMQIPIPNPENTLTIFLQRGLCPKIIDATFLA